MALQGTLSDFGIDDVLRLLEHGKKRGRLRVTSPAGSGNVWVDNGSVIASASNADEVGGDHTEVVFQLMRLEEGEFNFHGDDTPTSSPATESVADVLSASSARLAEWKQLSKVLPSVERWLALSEEIPTAATLEPEQWKVLALIGGGTRISTCVDELGVGLVPGCRVIVELVDRSLLTVTEEQPARAAVQSGKLEAQLPSVGAHHDDEESEEPETETSLAAETDDEESEESEADPTAEADEPEAQAAEDATDAAAEAADDGGHVEDEEAEAEGDGADVNPRALLRLLNSVK